MKDTRKNKRAQQTARNEIKWHDMMAANYRRVAQRQGENYPDSVPFYNELRDAHIKASRGLQRKLEGVNKNKKKFSKRR